jgi:hypothetical protein
MHHGHWSGLGFIFFWFGALKFVSGMSPAEDLAARTIEHLTVGTSGPAVSLPVLATLGVRDRARTA